MLTIKSISRTHGKPFALVTSDNAKEYVSKAAKTPLEQHGITFKPISPYNLQQNSIAERLNLTLFQATRASLHHAKLQPCHWEDAIRDATFKYNITVHWATKKLPYTLFHGFAPNITQLFAFGQIGSVAYTKLHPKPKGHKLDGSSYPARYMYDTDPTHIVDLNLKTNAYTKIRAIDFVPYHPLQDPTATHAQAFEAIARHPTPSCVTSNTPAPGSHTQARKYPDAVEWATAHNNELDQLDKTGVIKWLPDHEIPKDAKLIPLTMTYRYKRDPTGATTTRKARCSIRGDKMSPHVHFNPLETSSHNADKTTVRLTFAISAGLNTPIEQFDIKCAYTHEPYRFNKPVFIKQFPRFNGSFRHPGTGGQLMLNLYGSPSGGFYYLEGLTKFLSQNGFTQFEQDPCLFFQRHKQEFTIITLTTDDFLVTASNQIFIDSLYHTLSEKNHVKRLGEPKLYIGWKIRRTPTDTIHISQPHYIQLMIPRMKMANSNPKLTPYVDGMNLAGPGATDTACPELKQICQQIIVEIRYIADGTRPDIFFITNRLAKAAHSPTKRHWHHLKRLVRYLRATPKLGITYTPLSNATHATSHKSANKALFTLHLLATHADADFANDIVDRKSISGAVHTFNGAPILWSSNKQTLQALSTCEAEYFSATEAVQSTQWLRRIMQELQLLPNTPTPVLIGNQAACTIATNTAPTKRRKFIHLRHHYLRTHHRSHNIEITHTPTHNMLADIFTKPLGRVRFEKLRNDIRVTPPPNIPKQRAIAPTSRQGGCQC